MQFPASRYKVTILIVLVAIIWATIVVRVTHVVKTDHDFGKTPNVTEVRTSMSMDSTSRLLLNYDDPFVRAKTSFGDGKRRRGSRPAGEVKINKVPIIEFYGILKNEQKEQVALLTVDGRFTYLSKNEKRDGFSVYSICPDSIGIKFAKSMVYIKRARNP